MYVPYCPEICNIPPPGEIKDDNANNKQSPRAKGVNSIKRINNLNFTTNNFQSSNESLISKTKRVSRARAKQLQNLDIKSDQKTFPELS